MGVDEIYGSNYKPMLGMWNSKPVEMQEALTI
jgi:hypothetical protein